MMMMMMMMITTTTMMMMINNSLSAIKLGPCRIVGIHYYSYNYDNADDKLGTHIW